MAQNAQKLFTGFLEGLAPRQRQVIENRFGLNKEGEQKTLAEIGDALRVTRERVRQIEKATLYTIGKEVAARPEASATVLKLEKFLKNCGGVAAQEKFLAYAQRIAAGACNEHLLLLAEASGRFFYWQEDKEYWPFYYLTKDERKAAEKFIGEWITFLKGKKEELLQQKNLYRAHFADFARARGLSPAKANAIASITKKIHENPFGDIGLGEWREVKPVTTRDKIYLILRKKRKPLHFEEITRVINGARLDARLALAPTVHNELIKDPRFVLVGRGMYGLREYGYEPGIAREVIHRILKQHGALSKKELVSKVKEQRFFKPNTIAINLQNRSFFERLPNGTYRVREA